MLPPPLPPPFPSEAPPAAKRGRHGEENNPAADDLEDGEVADDEVTLAEKGYLIVFMGVLSDCFLK